MSFRLNKRDSFLKKLPTRYQWKQFFKILTKKEKIFFLVFLILSFGSFLFLSLSFYFKNTKIVPAYGGKHIEGVIGQPRFITPVYANSDVDRDLVELVFSGLMKYDENLNIVPDLAQSYEISDDKKTYTFYLKKDLYWQDKTPLTADDIIFTIKTIQNPNIKSPLQKNWIGVQIEKINNSVVKFKLKNPYSSFLENCTVKIIPKHIWEKVSPENFPLQIHNLKPVGSGPYQLKKIKKEDNKIKSLLLVSNPLYHNAKPYISKIEFLFFDNEKELLRAAKFGKIKGFSLTSFENFGENFQPYFFSFPRYFAVFFNQKNSKVLSEKNVRIALNYATNKKEIAKKFLNLPTAEKSIVHSPVLPKIYGLKEPSNYYNFDIEKAKEILEKAGFKEQTNGPRIKTIKKEPAFQFKSYLQTGSRGKEVEELQKCLAKFSDIYPEGKITGYFGEKTKSAVIRFQEKYKEEILTPWGFNKGTGIVSKTTRKKLNEVCFNEPEEIIELKFSLVTVDQPKMVEIANFLKENWQKIGAEIEVKYYPLYQLEQDFIKPRNYQALLFGEVLSAIVDPLPFWHSSQKRDPGLNLALFESKEADKLLEEIRETFDPETKKEKLKEFQDLVIQQVPVVFLFSPDYIYYVTKQTKGIQTKKIISPSHRFSDIEKWFIKTKRVWR